MLPAEHEDRVRLQAERIQHWVSQGAVATDRVAKFLGQKGVGPMPAWGEQPVKSAPKKKAQERAKAAEAAGGLSAGEPHPDGRDRPAARCAGAGARHVVCRGSDGLRPLSDAQGRRFVLRWRGEGVAEIAEVVGGAEVKVADRTAAEKLTNTRLYVDRAQLPEPEDDEFYLADLIGLAAVDVGGEALGTVGAVHDYGAGASLEVAARTGRRCWCRSRGPACRRSISLPGASLLNRQRIGSCLRTLLLRLRDGGGGGGASPPPAPPAEGEKGCA